MIIIGKIWGTLAVIFILLIIAGGAVSSLYKVLVRSLSGRKTLQRNVEIFLTNVFTIIENNRILLWIGMFISSIIHFKIMQYKVGYKFTGVLCALLLMVFLGTYVTKIIMKKGKSQKNEKLQVCIIIAMIIAFFIHGIAL